jgi:hypothetical protein
LENKQRHQNKNRDSQSILAPEAFTTRAIFWKSARSSAFSAEPVPTVPPAPGRTYLW